MTALHLERLRDVAAACVALRAAPDEAKAINRLAAALKALHRQRDVESFVRSDAYRQLRESVDALKSGA